MNTKNKPSELKVGSSTYSYFPLSLAGSAETIGKLPFSLKILLENLLRFEDGVNITREDVRSLASWHPSLKNDKEISFMPARVILQDFTGVPCIVDLASMRDAVVSLGGDPSKINPLQQVDLVIDHSVQVDRFGSSGSFQENVDLEYQRNKERYSFLRWGQKAFKNFRVVPPGTGIVHQVNLERLADVVYEKEGQLYPDTVIGTDSHTTMINGLGVLGWGVGGIEAEAAMLGQPVTMLIPDVVGFKLHGTLPEGTTATDLVLTVTQMLRKKGVVGKFVEFYGKGLSSLSLADRATVANMAPEYGATMGFFPVDQETLNYLKVTGRSNSLIERVRAYTQVQGLFRTDETPDPLFSDTLELDLSTVKPSVAGPKRPQDRLELGQIKASFSAALPTLAKRKDLSPKIVKEKLGDGSVVIAAITSCTNTSNPSVLIQAGLLAKKAVEMGLGTQPWVKTSLAPGSKVVTEYLKESGVLPYLEKLGFYLVGYGCTTCIGNSGPLPEAVESTVKSEELVVASVLSGNRNFEGRVHPLVRANYLMSPPLVVAYAIAGTVDIDLITEPVGISKQGAPVFLKDIWPTHEDVQEAIRCHVKSDLFSKQYENVFKGDSLWSSIPVPEGDRFDWQESSTYIRRAAFLERVTASPAAVSRLEGARVLACLGDSVTTDHISPAGSIADNSAAGSYLVSHGLKKADFNSYGARRGNHEVMVRGTFANGRLKNSLVPGTEGSVTKKLPEGITMSIYDASVAYAKEKTPLIVLAGKEYGSGSSRDWAAKGVMMLGVRAVLAESFERIHRSNLVMMGVLPLQFEAGESISSHGLTGFETFDVSGIEAGLKPGQRVRVTVKGEGILKTFQAIVRIDTPKELEYFQNGGILPYVLRQLLKI